MKPDLVMKNDPFSQVSLCPVMAATVAIELS